MSVDFEEFDQALAKRVVIRVRHHRLSFARASEGDRNDVAHFGLGAVRHAHNSIAKVECLIHVVRHHERGDAILSPQLQEHAPRTAPSGR